MKFFKSKTQKIIAQMQEPRPLPMTPQQFEEWSDRIISGACLPIDKNMAKEASDSQKFALGTMLMHLKPTEDHESDGYFIKSLRKSAINQVAHARMEEIRNAAKARLAGLQKENTVEDKLSSVPQEP